MMGFSKSSSVKPTARIMARLGERLSPWVMARLRRLSLGLVVLMALPPGKAYCTASPALWELLASIRGETIKQKRTNQITAGLFLLVGVVYVLLNNIYIGGIFIVAGAIFLVLSLTRQTTNKAKLTPEQRSEVEGLVERGKKTKAVERVREVSGASLTDAKAYVDALEKQSREDKEVKKGGRGGSSKSRKRR